MDKKKQRQVKMDNNYSVFVVDGGYDYIKLMYELGFMGAKNLEAADFVLFTGGEDVSPQLYDEQPLRGTFFNIHRDQREMVIYNECVAEGIPMVGICRGGQFLNVMNGGKMWQHVDGHANGMRHMMLEIAPKKADKMIEVTSTHHQMMRPHKDGTILAIGVTADGRPISDLKMSYGKELAGKNLKEPDVEVVYYEKTRSLCFQPHPEFPQAPEECVAYFDTLLCDYILPFCK